MSVVVISTYTPTLSSPVPDWASYTYDKLGRPDTVTHGDTRVTTFTFTEPTSPSAISRIYVNSSSDAL
jgi:hypothetical protein